MTLLLVLTLALPDTLTLEQARTLFLQRNPELRALTLQTRLAHQSWLRATVSALLPHLQLSYQYQNLQQNPAPPAFGFQENPWHTLTWQLEQTLWSGYAVSGALDQWWQDRQARARARQARNQLFLALYQAYLEGVTAQEALSLAHLQVRRARETLQQVEEKQRLGTASSVEVLQARLQWHQARLDSLQAVLRYRKAQQHLAQILGLEQPPDPWVLVPDTTPLPDPTPWIQDLQDLLQRHPETQQARWSLRQGQTGFWFTLLSFLPTVKYGITWSYADQDFPGWSRFREHHTRTRGWYVSLVFPFHTYPLDVALQKTSWDLAATQFRQAWLQRWTEVQDALSAYETAREGLNLARTRLDLARESFRLARAQYQEGLLSELELLNAQEQLRQAELQHLEARSRYRLSLYSLKLAVGEDLP